jgi:hypothetical protein
VNIIEELCVSLLQKETWPWEVARSESGMQRVFGFRSVMLNYLKGCPREGVREMYYGRVVSSILREYGKVRETGMAEDFLCKIALNGQVDVLTKD